jgi:hypothetical protein
MCQVRSKQAADGTAPDNQHSLQFFTAAYLMLEFAAWREFPQVSFWYQPANRTSREYR